MALTRKERSLEKRLYLITTAIPLSDVLVSIIFEYYCDKFESNLARETYNELKARWQHLKLPTDSVQQIEIGLTYLSNSYRQELTGISEAVNTFLSKKPNEVLHNYDIGRNLVYSGTFNKGRFSNTITGIGIYQSNVNQDVYIGMIANCISSGKGTYFFSSGDRYEGDFVNNNMTGKGTMLFTSGDFYEGDFVNGKMTGKGICLFANKDRYEGDFLESKMTGKGIYVFANGDRHAGSFVDGKMTGKGTRTFTNGNRYDGDFVDDNMTGNGTMLFTSGDCYKGDFINGEMTGKGTYFLTNGNRYEGNIVEGKITGKGTCFFSDGTQEYKYYFEARHITLEHLISMQTDYPHPDYDNKYKTTLIAKGFKNE